MSNPGLNIPNLSLASMMQGVQTPDPQNPTYGGGAGYSFPSGSPQAQQAGTAQQISQSMNPPSVSPTPQDMAGPDIPDRQNPTQAPTPGAQGFGGKLKAALQRFAYYGSQAGLKEAGLPTDFDIQAQDARIANINAQTAQIKDNMSMVPLTGLDGKPMMNAFGQPVMLPKVVAGKVLQAQQAAQGRVQVQQLRNEGNMDVAGMKQTPEQILGQQYTAAIQKGDVKGAQQIAQQMKAWRDVSGKSSSPFGKVDPIIGAALGTPPDFQTDPQGAIEWSQKAEAMKTRMAAMPRIQAYGALTRDRAMLTPFQTSDANGNPITISAFDAIRSGAPALSVWNSVYGPTGATKTQAQAAGAVADHIGEFKAAVQRLDARGELGPVMGRLNDYLTRGYGGSDPDISEFVTTVGLLKSGAVRAHFGARGGAQILDKFDNYLNTGQTGPALIGSINGIDKFLQTYKDVGTAKPPKNPQIPPAQGGANVQEPTRPSNVPAGYKFNANGPKGAGWYKP